ncbi:hypothetical protein LTR22_027818 [Elasticomyces elasticus]|nr:hypothetical protein LTR22_027818 [Elasticomyces elasticus]
MLNRMRDVKQIDGIAKWDEDVLESLYNITIGAPEDAEVAALGEVQPRQLH